LPEAPCGPIPQLSNEKKYFIGAIVGRNRKADFEKGPLVRTKKN